MNRYHVGRYRALPCAPCVRRNASVVTPLSRSPTQLSRSFAAEVPLRRAAPLALAWRVEICHRQQVVVFPWTELVENKNPACDLCQGKRYRWVLLPPFRLVPLVAVGRPSP